MRRGVIAGTTAAALVAGTAAVALAVPPPPSSTFQGSTTQTSIKKHGVQVETDSNARVSRVIIQWRATCKAKGKFWTSTTPVTNGQGGLAQSGDVFSRKRTYTANAGGGFKGKIKYALSGQFTDNDNASGTYSAKVVVKKNGKKIDSCKLPKITWTASRVGQG
jgi:hypothetical protein